MFLQINTMSQKFRLGYQLKALHQDESSVPYVPLLIHLTPKTLDSLRYCSNSGSVRMKSYLPVGRETKFRNNEYTRRL